MPKLLRNALACGGLLVLMTAGNAIGAAALVTPTTGQPGAPNNTCGPDNPVTPGHAASAPGSPFNPNVTKFYAGNPNSASLAHSNSAAAVSQYDTACVRLSH